MSLSQGRVRMVRIIFLSACLGYGHALYSQIDTIKAVEIREEQRGTQHDLTGGRLTTTLTENEFKKAACCTLSESFELSNTVEVSNKDGVSGIRQIEMLGLSGKYVLMTRNNMPILNGISQLNGLSNIPGAFVSSVNIAKGNGSATLGYEGLTGGIDYDLKSNTKTPRLFVNGYQNNQGRTEANVLIRKDINEKLRNYTYLHGGKQWITTDMNQDGFSDMPMTDRVFLGNQTHFQTKHTEGVIGFSAWEDSKIGGATYEVGGNSLSTDPSKFFYRSNENRLDVFAKLGIIPEEGETTFGNILNLSWHQMDYGLNSLIGRTYGADEFRINYSGLMQSEITETWGIKTGVSFLATKLSEQFQSKSQPSNTQAYNGNIDEIQYGAFFESVYATEELKVVLGTRIDHNNYYGWFFTPRAHIKYDFNKNNNLFLQGGYGRRQSYLIAENIPMLINQREIKAPFFEGNNQTPYGFTQERGWNYGLSYLYKFMFLGYPSNLSIDIFRNQFDKRIVVDQENPFELNFVQLEGAEAGFSESIHAEWSFVPLMRLELRMAYRYVNNIMKLGNDMKMAPQVSRHRALTTITYRTRNKWYFDLVGSVNGPKRLFSLPGAEIKEFESPVFALFNAQIRKSLNSGWEFYLGIENIGNFRQLDPIFYTSNAIDASYSWGPSNGRLTYIGFRYELN